MVRRPSGNIAFIRNKFIDHKTRRKIITLSLSPYSRVENLKKEKTSELKVDLPANEKESQAI